MGDGLMGLLGHKSPEEEAANSIGGAASDAGGAGTWGKIKGMFDSQMPHQQQMQQQQAPEEDEDTTASKVLGLLGSGAKAAGGFFGGGMM